MSFAKVLDVMNEVDLYCAVCDDERTHEETRAENGVQTLITWECLDCGYVSNQLR